MNAEFLEHLFRKKIELKDKIATIHLLEKHNLVDNSLLNQLAIQEVFVTTTIRIYIETHRHWKHENG